MRRGERRLEFPVKRISEAARRRSEASSGIQECRIYEQVSNCRTRNQVVSAAFGAARSVTSESNRTGGMPRLPWYTFVNRARRAGLGGQACRATSSCPAVGGAQRKTTMKPAIETPSGVSRDPYQKGVCCLRCEQRLERYQLMRPSLTPGAGHAMLSCPRCGHVEFVSESSPLLQSLELVPVDSGDGD